MNFFYKVILIIAFAVSVNAVAVIFPSDRAFAFSEFEQVHPPKIKLGLERAKNCRADWNICVSSVEEKWNWGLTCPSELPICRDESNRDELARLIGEEIFIVGDIPGPEMIKTFCAENLPYIYCVGGNNVLFRALCKLGGGEVQGTGPKVLCSGAPTSQP